MADSIGAFANAPYGSKVVTVSPMLVSNGTTPIGSEAVPFPIRKASVARLSGPRLY